MFETARMLGGNHQLVSTMDNVFHALRIFSTEVGPVHRGPAALRHRPKHPEDPPRLQVSAGPAGEGVRGGQSTGKASPIPANTLFRCSKQESGVLHRSISRFASKGTHWQGPIGWVFVVCVFFWDCLERAAKGIHPF